MITKSEISKRNNNPNYRFRVKGRTKIYNKIGLAAAACPIDGEVETLEMNVVATNPCVDFLDKKKVDRRIRWSYLRNEKVESVAILYKNKFIDEEQVRYWVREKYTPITPFEIAQIKMLGVEISDALKERNKL